MDPRIKALVVLLPFVVAGYVGISLLQPAIEESNLKDTTIGEKTKEKEELDAKLAGSNKISQKKIELTQAIDKLRGSVPKTPDIDLLTIDLEKMCKDAGMNMVAITAPKTDSSSSSGTQKRAEEERSAYLKKKQDKLKNVLKGNETPAAAGTAGTADDMPKNELSQTSKAFVVTGDFNGLQKLCHELETYQRVVRIDDMKFSLPKKEQGKDKVKIDDSAPTDGEEGGDPNLLYITMTLTTFYLP